MKRPRLRVVEGNTNPNRESKKIGLVENRVTVPVGHQLPLPLDDKPASCTVFIVVTNEMHGQSICKLVETERPQSVMDLRHLLRFDMPGISREGFFDQLRMSCARYVRIPVPWHELGAREFMAGDVSISPELTSALVARKGSKVVLLVSTEQEAVQLSVYINALLSRESSESWKVMSILGD